jgi:hypothetical protein
MKYRVRVICQAPVYVDLEVEAPHAAEAEAQGVAEIRDWGMQQRRAKAAGEQWVGGDYEWNIVDDLTTGDLAPESLEADNRHTEEIDESGEGI